MKRVGLFLVGMLVVGSTVSCGSDDDASEPPAGVTSTVQAFNDAINTYDSDALLAVTTEDFTWQSTGDVQSRAEFVDYFEANYEVGNFNFAPTGELTVESDGDGYVAEELGRVTSSGYNEDGSSTYRLVEMDGSWLVQEFRWSEESADE